MERVGSSGELQLDMLPPSTGNTGEETQGVHCFIKHYWCVREDATEEEIQAALAFLNFLVSPRTDGTVPVDDLALLAPYRQAVYARNSVQQRLRNDIAQGKKCIICKP
jgi:raffinose/stachyose/melibiose transport system substrate-binding protein